MNSWRNRSRSVIGAPVDTGVASREQLLHGRPCRPCRSTSAARRRGRRCASACGTLNALSRAFASRREVVDGDRVGRRQHDERGDRERRRRASTSTTYAAPTPSIVRSAALDLARVDRRAAHLEHVVAPAGEEEVAVVVEAAEVAGRVEAVDGEDLRPAPPADPAHQVRAAQLDLARAPVGDRRTGVDVDDPDLDARERPAAAPLLARWERAVETVAASRDRTTRSCRGGSPGSRAAPAAPAGGPRRGCRDAATRGRRSRSARSRGERGRLVGPAPEQRDLLAFEERQGRARARARLGEQRGAGDERREQPGAEAADPEERHRDVEAVVAAEAPRVEAGRGGARARRRACGSRPSGAPRLPEVKMTARSSAGRTDASSASTRSTRYASSPAPSVDASQAVIDRSRGSSSTNSPAPGTRRGEIADEVGEVVATEEPAHEHEVLDARRCAAAPRARVGGATCSAGRASRRRGRHRTRPPASRCRWA